METLVNDKEFGRLAQIGKVLDSIGISTVEIAEKLKEHLTGCPGGMKCIEKLIHTDETK